MARFVLSIDGGGVRGLLPALVLQELLGRVGERLGRRPEAHECFDLIAGTETGGLLAAGLTAPAGAERDRPALGVDGLVAFFRKRVRKIYPNGWFAPRVGDRLYDHRRLERLLGELFGATRLSECLAPVMMTAYDLEARRPAHLVAGGPYAWSDLDATYRDAVRATTATPTWFQPAEVKNAFSSGKPMPLIGGTLFANDPAMAVLAEAARMDWGHEKIFVLSLGTGRSTRAFPAKKARKWTPERWLDRRKGSALIAIAAQASADGVAYQADLFLNQGGELQYTRIDGPLGAGVSDRADLASGRNLKALERQAQAWIAEHSRDLDAWAQRLARRLGWVDPAAAVPAPVAAPVVSSEISAAVAA
jgi:predicted acylesterase/phospholipase RssA